MSHVYSIACSAARERSTHQGLIRIILQLDEPLTTPSRIIEAEKLALEAVKLQGGAYRETGSLFFLSWIEIDPDEPTEDHA